MAVVRLKRLEVSSDKLEKLLEVYKEYIEESKPGKTVDDFDFAVYPNGAVEMSLEGDYHSVFHEKHGWILYDHGEDWALDEATGLDFRNSTIE